MKKNVLLLLLFLMLTPILSNAKDKLEKGDLIYQNEKIKLYSDSPQKTFDKKIEQDVLMVRAIVDNINSEDYHMIVYMFDCQARTVRSVADGFLVDKETNEFSRAPLSIHYNKHRYNRVLKGSATYLFFKHICKQ
jgi:hypothetical protein